MRRALAGAGTVEVAAPRDRVWPALLDPAILRSLIPGADLVERSGDRYRAHLSFGVGRVRGHYDVGLELSGVAAPRALDLSGASHGRWGGGSAAAHVEMAEAGGAGTVISWTYRGVVTGPVALAGTTLLEASAARFIHRFFATFARHVAAGAVAADPGRDPTGI